MHTAREIHYSGGSTRSSAAGWGVGGARQRRSSMALGGGRGHLWRPAVPPNGGARHGLSVCGGALARGRWGCHDGDVGSTV